MVWSSGLLVAALPSHKESPQDMLRSAAALWITNILVFASWYWRLDAGGPHAREQRGVHTDGAFLFPQMTLSPQKSRDMQEECWSPGFVDYLFLAFNTNAAFSPTDSPVLSAWAKVLMMWSQALISFATVALLAARARQHPLARACPRRAMQQGLTQDCATAAAPRVPPEPSAAEQPPKWEVMISPTGRGAP